MTNPVLSSEQPPKMFFSPLTTSLLILILLRHARTSSAFSTFSGGESSVKFGKKCTEVPKGEIHVGCGTVKKGTFSLFFLGYS